VKDWKSHCAILEVKEDASLKEVRKAYRRLALERHPDMHNGSKEAHEAFQQLNESYNFVAAALIQGHIPSPSPAQPGNYSGTLKPAQPGPVFTTKPSAPVAPPRGVPRVWIHAGVACLALLIISLFFERPGAISPSRNTAYKPDLFPKAWCFINSGTGQELAALFTQKACEEKCGSAAALKEVTCEWSGDKFHLANGNNTPPSESAAPSQSDLLARASCEITVEKPSGFSSTPYRNQPESTCQSLCTEMMKEKSRDGVRCSWNGKEFNQQAMTIPKETKPLEYNPPISRQEKKLAEIYGADAPITPSDPEFRSTCYMSVVSVKEGVRSSSFDNEIYATCEKRCLSEVMAHQYDGEVQCSFAGGQIINHPPDPMPSPSAREPAGKLMRKSNGQFFATCDILMRNKKNTVRVLHEVSSDNQCADYCEYEMGKTPKGAELVCAFNEVTFLQSVIKK
jgi:hypothetical protein